jgi:hypothetical protein
MNKVKEAIEKSIEHWEKMIAFAETLPQEERPCYYKMLIGIGEDWHGGHCPLCEIFTVSIDEDGTREVECTKCPLNTGWKGCNQVDSPWKRVNNSLTWKEWLIRAKEMLAVLKELYKGVKE